MDRVEDAQARKQLKYSNLPRPATRFIGRAHDVAAVRRLLSEACLVTLTGAGGVGKTRLSLEVAAQALEDFEDGVCLVELTNILDPGLVEQEVCRALGAMAGLSQPDLSVMTQILQDKNVLLLLDNCEHLVAACAGLGQALMQACRRLHILATSRESLGVTGETVWQVPLLSLPDPQTQVTVESLMQSEAVRLFVERARAARPDFAVTDGSAEAVAQVCRRLEGVPLAIELAASWVRILSPAQIAGRLQQSFDLLEGGKRSAALPHQKTIRGTIDWSYNLLTGLEKALFRRLAIFDGPFTLNSVESICADPDEAPSAPGGPLPTERLPREEILDLLYHLVDKSLLLINQRSEAFFSMLETVRQYASELLRGSGEWPLLRERFAAHYLAITEQAETKFLQSDQPAWLDRLEGELDNLRGALQQFYEAKDAERGLRLASALSGFWYLHAYFDEGSRWLAKMLDLDCTDDLPRLKAYVKASHLAEQLGRFPQGIAYVNKALEIAEKVQDRRGMADALMRLGTLTNAQGERQKGVVFLEQSLALYRALDDEISQGMVLLHLGDTRMRLNALDQAHQHFEEALLTFERSGESSRISFALGGLGDIARLRGDNILAFAYFRESLVNYRRFDNKVDVIFNLEAQAILLEALGKYDRAACLWGATEALRETMHLFLAPAYRQDYAVHIQAVKMALGEAVFAALKNRGRGFTLEETITFALSVSDRTPLPANARHAPESTPPFGLSPREMDVLRLLASGLTDAQIAARLYLSPRTVSKHLQSIYRKIEVSSRSAATHFAFEHHLV